jgi:hypothetical protein
MKRKLIFGVSFLLCVWAVTSCEALSDCGYCKEVEYENGSVINESIETEYCGIDLINKKATKDVTINDRTTKVVCR